MKTGAKPTNIEETEDAPVIEAAIDILGRLVSFDTVSSKSNYDAIDYIATYFEELGARVERIQARNQQKQNLWVTFGKGTTGGYVLSGHIDVVPVTGQEWSRPPFALTPEGDRVYGRGTTDMKGFIACVMAASALIDADTLTRPVHIAITFDEEIGCIGANELAAFMEGASVKPAAIFVGEPTQMAVVDRHKGSVGFRTEIGGTAAHSSQVHLGLSAIQIAGELITFLTSLGNAQKNAPADLNFPYPYPSINVGVIKGGHVRNIVAPECTLEWEMRPILPSQLTKMRAAFDAHVAGMIASREKTGEMVPVIETVCVWDSPPLVADPHSHATSVALHTLGHNETLGVSYGTEAGIYQMAGHPTVVCGPGDIQQAHTADEWIAVDQLKACLAFLERLLNTSAR
jgi:acetylornithine deacetylase